MKTLEELGIGRPWTYAPILRRFRSGAMSRRSSGRVHADDFAEVVKDKLIQHFPDIVDVNFTARMEEELDEIAEGNATRVAVLQDFYVPFAEELALAEEKFERYLEETEELCPKCPTEGREPGRLQVRLGRFGKFIGCENFPDCDYIRNLDGSERPEPELLEETCPDCGRQLVKKVGSLRAVHRLQRLPGLSLHQEGAAEEHRRHLPPVRPRRARGEADPVRPDVRVRSLPGVRLRDEQPSGEGHPLPGLWRVAPPSPQEPSLLALRGGGGSGHEGHEAG